MRARGPFGEKSVVEFPGYEPPAWLLDADVPEGDVRDFFLRSRRLGMVRALLWTAAGTRREARLPLLVVHDGPEYAEYSALLRLLDFLVSTGEAPELRALLLPPGPRRDELYSASTRYANALVFELLPAALAEAPSDRPPVLMGASLGALAALHAHALHPATFGGLFLQSGSFFRPRFDAHESDLLRSPRITRFVGDVSGRRQARPVPTTITCGTAEENLANNRVLASELEALAWPVRTFWNRDAHNWTAWRDALHPRLAELLRRAWA